MITRPMPPFFDSLSELVFIERKGLFTHPDVVLFHPGHFPELNRPIAELYATEGFERVLIPSIHNALLDASEHDYHRPILLEYGIPDEKIAPIVGEQRTVNDIIRNAISSLQEHQQTVLLAGKAFFCRRFLLLASQYASPNMTLDVYPMEDERGINKDSWQQSEKGRERVLNEIKQYAAIVESQQLLN